MISPERHSARNQAQELALQAMEYMGHDEARAAQLCRQALEICPDCVDALHMLADLESQWQRDFVIGVKKAIEAGRRDLGEEYFQEHKGSFWGLIETRPFMRAMGALADALASNEFHQDEAIAVHEEMLDLNPNDNQGIRYGLLGCYLARKRYHNTQQLLDRYSGEYSAFFLWGKVLLLFATEGEKAASRALGEARKENPHVEQYFFPRKRCPDVQLEYYSRGDETEAIACAQALHVAWKTHSTARKWLQQACMSVEKRPRQTRKRTDRAGRACGLCGKTKNLTKTECCGNWICDDEHEYVMFSYARNSCHRNHSRFTLCGSHFTEGHEGRWQDCPKCREEIETEMYVYFGTNEYNFEKLANPPPYEPTTCHSCGRVIVLSEGGYSSKGGHYFCGKCMAKEMGGRLPW